MVGVPKISVIMPAYNAQTFIGEAIRSVLQQKGVPFELLIGDDGSTDDTWACIQSYRQDPRLRCWRSSPHRNAAAVRNHLISRARGRYLSICDADDRLLPGNLRILSHVLDCQSRIGVVCPEWRFINTHGKGLPRRRRVIPWESMWDLVKSGACHGGSMIRRRLMRQVKGYREDLSYSEDYDLLLRLGEVTRFKMLEGKALYAYRLRPYPRPYHQQILKRERQAIREAIYRRYRFAVPW